MRQITKNILYDAYIYALCIAIIFLGGEDIMRLIGGNFSVPVIIASLWPITFLCVALIKLAVSIKRGYNEHQMHD